MLTCAATEITYVHATQDQFFRSAVEGLLSLEHKRSDRGVATLTARQRDGAIGAEIIATVLHLDETAGAVILAVRPVEIVHLADGRKRYFRDIEISRPRDLEFLDELLQVEFLILSEDVIDTFYMRYLVGFELGIAARDNEDGVGVLTSYTMDHLPVLMVGGVCDGAGIDDAYVGGFTGFGTCVTTCDESFSQGTGLRKIKFAS